VSSMASRSICACHAPTGRLTGFTCVARPLSSTNVSHLLTSHTLIKWGPASYSRHAVCHVRAAPAVPPATPPLAAPPPATPPLAAQPPVTLPLAVPAPVTPPLAAVPPITHPLAAPPPVTL